MPAKTAVPAFVPFEYRSRAAVLRLRKGNRYGTDTESSLSQIQGQNRCGRFLCHADTGSLGPAGCQRAGEDHIDENDCRDPGTFRRSDPVQRKTGRKTGEAYRKVFGWLPQDFGFPPEFTVREYLIYVAVLKGLDREQTVARIRELLDEVSLTEVANRKIAKLSGGCAAGWESPRRC